MKLPLKKFFQPVGAHSPGLEEALRKGVRLTLFLNWIVVTGFTVVGFFFLEVPFGFYLLLGPVSVAYNLLLFWLHRSKYGACLSEWIALCLGCFVAVHATVGGGEGVFVSAIPLIQVAIIPWKPQFSLVLGGFIALLNACLFLWMPGMDQTLFALQEMTVLVATIGSVAVTQVRRHVWEEVQERQQRLLASERLSVLGENMAGIAHDLKTPIAATLNEMQSMKSLLEEMEESIGHPDINDEDLEEIRAEISQHLSNLDISVDRISKLVRAIQEHTRRTHVSSSTGTFSLHRQAESVAALMNHRIKKSRIRFEFQQIPQSVVLRGDEGKFEQVLINLISNAFNVCEESQQGSLVRIAAERNETGVLISVIDDGPGVPEEHRDKIFESMFTTRADTDGTGLGLSLCRQIIEKEFSGTLTLARATSGARFDIFVPGPQDDLVSRTMLVATPRERSAEAPCLH